MIFASALAAMAAAIEVPYDRPQSERPVSAPPRTTLPVGKIPIQGDQIYALVQDNTTKTRDQGVWEAHRKYIDVQFVAAGVEEMGYANIQTLTVKQPYDEQVDYALFDGSGSFVTVAAGSFTIFFPEDGHIPGSAVDGQPAAVRKVVVKVAV